LWKGVPHREVVHRLFKLSRRGFEVKILNFPDDAMMQAAVADCATFNFFYLYSGFLFTGAFLAVGFAGVAFFLTAGAGA
jgi:hypothetical protein